VLPPFRGAVIVSGLSFVNLANPTEVMTMGYVTTTDVTRVAAGFVVFAGIRDGSPL
jgi:hypothetical protein